MQPEKVTNGSLMYVVRKSPYGPGTLGWAVVPFAAWSKDLAIVALALLALPALRAVRIPRDIGVTGWSAVALSIWAGVSLIWAPAGAWQDAVKVLVVLALGWSVVTTGAATADRAVVVSVVALFVVLVVERLTGGGIIGLIRTEEPMLRRFDVLSAGLAFLCCLAFPAASLIARRSLTHAAVLPVAIGALAVSYYMDAAPIALLAGAAAYGLIHVTGRSGFAVVISGLLFVSVAWGDLVGAAWAAGWTPQLNAYFGPNWGLRLDIWHAVDELISRHPWIGHGFAAGKIIGRAGSEVPFMHPHNGMLQIGLELGLVGVALSIVLVLSAILHVARSPALPMIGATVTVVAVFWLVSFNLWASWWLAAQALVIAAVIVAVKAAPASPQVPVATDGA
ncbi:MAG: O-antigen ligase family protein [Alphaproteobacteria bacterium]|nr:O-antigen ligase family protein [Alphaproteobacteria bacterium]